MRRVVIGVAMVSAMGLMGPTLCCDEATGGLSMTPALASGREGPMENVEQPSTSTADHDALLALNEDYIRSVQTGDVARFDEILATISARLSARRISTAPRFSHRPRCRSPFPTSPLGMWRSASWAMSASCMRAPRTGRPTGWTDRGAIPTSGCGWVTAGGRLLRTSPGSRRSSAPQLRRVETADCVHNLIYGCRRPARPLHRDRAHWRGRHGAGLPRH